jgi:hypothetical protein
MCMTRDHWRRGVVLPMVVIDGCVMSRPKHHEHNEHKGHGENGRQIAFFVRVVAVVFVVLTKRRR